MEILVIHNFHRTGSASGDDQVYKNETALLESNGSKVIRYVVNIVSIKRENCDKKMSSDECIKVNL